MPASLPRIALFVVAFVSAVAEYVSAHPGPINWLDVVAKLPLLLAGATLRFPGDVEKAALPKEWQDALDGVSDIPDPRKSVK
jgi:hypothetical protein